MMGVSQPSTVNGDLPQPSQDAAVQLPSIEVRVDPLEEHPSREHLGGKANGSESKEAGFGEHIATAVRSAKETDTSVSTQVARNPRQPRLTEQLRLPSAPISQYPIPHPPIHRPATADGKEYEPIPWQRCVVESIQPAFALGIPRTGRHKVPGHQMSRIMECRVVDSAQATIANGRAPEASCPDRRIRCVLKGEWAGIALEVGDFVNIISPEVSDERLDVTTTTSDIVEIEFSHTAAKNSLIAHPDILYSMTALARAVGCPRRPLIMELVKRNGITGNPKVLYGNLQHQLFQTMLKTRRFSPGDVQVHLNALLLTPEYQMEMWSCGLTLEEVRTEVGCKARLSLAAFGDKWVGEEPNPEASLQDSHSAATLAITGLHDIEESILSPKWGMTGRSDASVHVTIKKTSGVDTSASTKGANLDRAESGPKPLEIKAGSNWAMSEHETQTRLYALMMEERYRTPIKSGLLYYTQTDSMHQVPAGLREIRTSLILRNQLAQYTARQRVTPERPASDQKCGANLANHIAAPNSQATDRVSQKGRHSAHVDVSLEKGALGSESSGIHRGTTGTAVVAARAERLQVLPPTIDNQLECGRCLVSDTCMLYRRAVDRIKPGSGDPVAKLYSKKTGHLTLPDLDFFAFWENLITIEEQGIHRLRVQLWTMAASERERNGRCFADLMILEQTDGPFPAGFHRNTVSFGRVPTSTISSTFLDSDMEEQDRVVLSIEPDVLSLARGVIMELNSTRVVIGTEERLEVQALLERNGRGPSSPVVWRIDKDDMLAGTGKMRTNIAQLFRTVASGGDDKRRKLIVHLQSPCFEQGQARRETTPDQLNRDQRAAVNTALTAKDYALIAGAPGTGKKTTIVEIVIELARRGKSVLLTSTTHAAVDDILLRLLNCGHRILRIGHVDKVHPSVRLFLVDGLHPADLDEWNDRLLSPQIVATTCLAIDHAIFARRHFDVCIVHDASQTTLPTCIGPLRFADAFVLVGDHFQLPPLVRSAEAKQGGLDVSLFTHLALGHPEAVVDLSCQYRMNDDIMSIANTLLYKNRLKCTSEDVANQVLELPKIDGDHGCGEDSRWISQALQPTGKAILLNTDPIAVKATHSQAEGSSGIEACLIGQLITELIARGLGQDQIGIIAPSNKQMKLISAVLKDQKGFDVTTADQTGGKEKDCIILSLMRLPTPSTVDESYRGWKRINLNVCLTLAKKKLIIIGSKSTLSAADQLLPELVSLFEERQWILDLPKDAARMHSAAVFPVASLDTNDKDEGRVAPKKRGTAKLSQSLIDGKPFFRDILNDIKEV